MAKNPTFSNKIKLLKLYEMLKQGTDEQHPISRQNLCEALVSSGIPCDIRTLSKDLKVLNNYGFEVMEYTVNHEKYYYVSDRSFDVPELKILIDAVQAASFITEKKTKILIEKIAALGGSNEAGLLKSNMVQFNIVKHTNESVYYNIDALEEALKKNCKVIFKYFDLDENKQRIYRREGHHYVVEPIGLIFNEDNYYLLCYSQVHDNTASYRIDRMDLVEVIDEKVSETAKSLRCKAARLTKSAFKMYGGESVDVTLQFDRELLGVVYDKFGEDTEIKKADNDTLLAVVNVQISPTFWGWVFQFGGKMTINSPDELKGKYREQLELLLPKE